MPPPPPPQPLTTPHWRHLSSLLSLFKQQGDCGRWDGLHPCEGINWFSKLYDGLRFGDFGRRCEENRRTGHLKFLLRWTTTTPSPVLWSAVWWRPGYWVTELLIMILAWTERRCQWRMWVKAPGILSLDRSSQDTCGASHIKYQHDNNNMSCWLLLHHRPRSRYHNRDVRPAIINICFTSSHPISLEKSTNLESTNIDRRRRGSVSSGGGWIRTGLFHYR